MKIKDGYLLREVAGSYFAIALGGDTDTFQNSMSMNETGKFLWEKLESDQTEDSLVSALLSEYEVGEELARKDVKAFLGKLRDEGALEE